MIKNPSAPSGGGGPFGGTDESVKAYLSCGLPLSADPPISIVSVTSIYNFLSEYGNMFEYGLGNWKNKVMEEAVCLFAMF